MERFGYRRRRPFGTRFNEILMRSLLRFFFQIFQHLSASALFESLITFEKAWTKKVNSSDQVDESN